MTNLIFPWMQNQNSTTSITWLIVSLSAGKLINLNLKNRYRPTKTQSRYLSRGNSMGKIITQMTKLPKIQKIPTKNWNKRGKKRIIKFQSETFLVQFQRKSIYDENNYCLTKRVRVKIGSQLFQERKEEEGERFYTGFGPILSFNKEMMKGHREEIILGEIDISWRGGRWRTWLINKISTHLRLNNEFSSVENGRWCGRLGFFWACDVDSSMKHATIIITWINE